MAARVTSVFLYVKDVRRSLEFYNEVVGAEVLQVHAEHEGAPFSLAILRLDYFTLMIHPQEAHAEEFADTHHEKTLDDIGKHLKLDRALINKAYYEGFVDQTSDPNVTGIVRFWKTMLKSDFVQSDKDITQFIDTKVYEKALQQVARENPGSAFWQKRLEIFARRDSLAARTAALNEAVSDTDLAAAHFDIRACCRQ